MPLIILGFAAAAVAPLAAGEAAAPTPKKVAFIAGGDSHGYGAHDHYAGCMLLAKCVQDNVPGFTCVVHKGFPADAKALDGVDAVIIYCDGGGNHIANKRLADLELVMNRGAGYGCLHYGVETIKGPPGEAFLRWMGGYFEVDWSVNPHWTPKFETFPDHPVSRGVKPFAVNDEWYYHMRFREGMKGVTPILTAVPGPETLSRKDSPHAGNPAVRAAVVERKEAQHMMWVSEREGGGRGFGFTGGHTHWNWAQDSFRTVVVNAVVWIAKGEVPVGGVKSPTPTLDDLKANQDEKAPTDFTKAQALIDSFKK